MRKGVVALSVIAALCIGISGAHAYPLNSNSWYMSAGYVGYHLHYKENVTPSDKDTGWLNGIDLRVGKVWKDSHVWLEIEGKYATTGKNNGDYNGASQNGAGYYASFSTDTTESIWNVESKGGIFQKWSNSLYTYEGLVIGYRYWRRSIKSGTDDNGNPVLGYIEKYTDWYGGLDLGVQYYPIEKLSIGLDLIGAMSPSWESTSKMKTDFAGLTKENTFDMGKAYYYKISLPIEYNATPNIAVNLTPYYDHWRFDSSDKITYDGVILYEPSSKTDEVGFTLNVTYKF